MTDPKSPVSSFGEELHKALRLGCQQEVVLEFPTEKLAHRFRLRIMALRKAMRAEKHPDWQETYRAGIFITGKTVTISPRDSEFKGMIDQLTTPLAAPLPPRPAPTEGEAPPADPADAFLADLHKASQKPS